MSLGDNLNFFLVITTRLDSRTQRTMAKINALKRKCPLVIGSRWLN